MNEILNKYFLIVFVALLVSFISKTVNAGEMKVQYNCSTDKAVVFATAEGPLQSGRELHYSPEPGKSLNLAVGRLPSGFTFWIRQPDGARRFATVLYRTGVPSETIELGEEGQVSSAVFSFHLRDGNDLIAGQCEIRVE